MHLIPQVQIERFQLQNMWGIGFHSFIVYTIEQQLSGFQLGFDIFERSYEIKFLWIYD